VLTIAYLNTVWNVDEFSAVDYTLNIVSKCRSSLYLNMLYSDLYGYIGDG